MPSRNGNIVLHNPYLLPHRNSGPVLTSSYDTPKACDNKAHPLLIFPNVFDCLFKEFLMKRAIKIGFHRHKNSDSY